MTKEYPDNKQRYAVCNSKWAESEELSDDTLEDYQEPEESENQNS